MTDSPTRFRAHCTDCGSSLTPYIDSEDDEIVLGCGECDEIRAVGDVRFADVDMLTGGQHV
jgi:lipoate synthase